MRRFDEDMVSRITEGVRDVEQRSGLEVVVRVERRSGSYRDVGLVASIVAGLGALCAMVYLPLDFGSQWLVPEVALIGGVFGWVVWRAPPMIRLFTSVRRRRTQALDCAYRCFMTHSVSGTRDRSGVLVYASVVEDRLIVLPDFGAEGAASAAEWARVHAAGDAQGELTARLFDVLSALGVLGEAHVPRCADDTNELPDEPSIG